MGTEKTTANFGKNHAKRGLSRQKPPLRRFLKACRLSVHTRLETGDKRRKIFGDGLPDNLKTNAVIIMDDAVAHAVDLPPGQVWMGGDEGILQPTMSQFANLKKIKDARV